MLATGVFALVGCSQPENNESITIDTANLAGCMEGMTLNVATTGTYAPFTYFDENGEDVIGFDLDLIAELQELLGFEIANNQIAAMNASTITASLAEGKVDMGLAALCATDERKEVMNFSNTYYDAGQIVLINKETSPAEIQGLDDLMDGKYTVAVETGSAAHLYVKSIGMNEDCIKPYNEGPIAFAALEDGKIDCFIQDAPGIPYYLETTPDSKIAMVGEQFNMGQSPYAIALSFDACTRYTNLQEVINLALEELTNNGTMDELDQKWCK
jgi:ABC-type amino acid transport substrate-binding protein